MKVYIVYVCTVYVLWEFQLTKPLRDTSYFWPNTFTDRYLCIALLSTLKVSWTVKLYTHSNMYLFLRDNMLF